MKRLAGLLTVACFLLSPLAKAERPKLRNSFALSTAARIVPAHHNGRWELVYELHMVNCSKHDFTLHRIELFEVHSGKARADLDEMALSGVIGRWN